MHSSRILFVFTILFMGVLFAGTYTETFEDLDYCNMAKTTGGWDVADSFGTVARQAPSEKSWGSATGQTMKCDFSGNYIYAADNNGVAKFEISSVPLTQSAHITTTGNAVDIEIHGSYAYVASSSNFYSVLLSNMSTNYNITCSAYGVAILGDYAYVGGGSDGLWRIDISDPTDMNNC
ncbi:hypothetical protein J7M00_04120, partial [bacterium]|nr:hypothetical protein [bacterium]